MRKQLIWERERQRHREREPWCSCWYQCVVTQPKTKQHVSEAMKHVLFPSTLCVSWCRKCLTVHHRTRQTQRRRRRSQRVVAATSSGSSTDTLPPACALQFRAVCNILVKQLILCCHVEAAMYCSIICHCCHPRGEAFLSTTICTSVNRTGTAGLQWSSERRSHSANELDKFRTESDASDLLEKTWTHEVMTCVRLNGHAGSVHVVLTWTCLRLSCPWRGTGRDRDPKGCGEEGGL